MTEQEAEQIIFGMSTKLISGRPRSTHELEVYLTKKAKEYALAIADQEVFVQRIIAKLTKLDFLNDTAFVKWWVENRSSFRPRGKTGLIAELRAKGIRKNDLDTFFSASDLDEVELAKQVLFKKHRTLSLYDSQTYRKKATDLLLRRGFSFGIIKQALKSAEENLER